MIFRNHDNDRRTVPGKLVGVVKTICRQINGKSAFVRVPDCGPISEHMGRFVGVRPSTFTTIGLHQLGKLAFVDPVAASGEISSLRETPSLIDRKSLNFPGEVFPCIPPDPA